MPKSTAKSDTKMTLSDKIYYMIRRDIVGHVLQPGEKINLKDLTTRYEVSATPVKLALNRLVSEHVIEDFPRQGMRVKPIEIREIEEIFDVRLMLDLYCMKDVLAAVNLNSQLMESFQKNIADSEALNNTVPTEATMDDFIRRYQLDDEFHQMYLKCSGNRKMVDVYNSLNPFLYSAYIFHLQSKQKDIAGVEEHKMIFNAILDRDEAALEKALRVHIGNAKDSISLILKVQQIM